VGIEIVGRILRFHPLLAPDEEAVPQALFELAKAGGEGGLAHVAAGCRRRDVLLFIDGDEEAQQSQVQHGDTIVNSDDNQRKTIFIADGCSDYSDWVPCWPALV